MTACAASGGPDAHDQAAAIRRGDVPRDHFVRDAINRIEIVGNEIGAIAFERFEQATAEALQTHPEAPFAGVPILVKDLMCPVEGLPQSNGNRLLKQQARPAERSSVLVERLRRAGFVVIGSSVTAEFGATITTETSAFGPCRNPWARDRSSGGSSGGAAASVAAGFVPVAHGNDASGSLRIPAAFCGVFGLKPARGRIDDGGDPMSWFGLAVQGPIARTVRDLQALTSVMAGDVVPAHIVADIECARPLRVGVLGLQSLSGIAGSVKDAVHDAARALDASGHLVDVLDSESTALLDPEFGRHFALMAATGVAAEISLDSQAGLSDLEGSLDAPTAALMGLANRRSARDLARTHAWLMEFRTRVSAWWAGRGIDVLLLPVTADVAPPLGTLTDPDTGGRRVSELMRFTAQFNVTGQVAMSVPTGVSGGLPTAIQLVGGPSPRGEADVLRLAEELTRS